MITIELTAIALILANVGFSYKGFQEVSFRNRYNFHIDPILIGKEYIRMLSSGFLHTGWWHLLFNMYALYIFSESLQFTGMSFAYYLILYFTSLLGGNALALYIHRNHGDYRAVGASGAVSGVVFATIAIFPFGEIFFIPAWLFGIIYTLVTIYGVKSRWGNIGHEAHLGGSMVGILMAILFSPNILEAYTWIILGMLIPMAAFLFLVIKRPEYLLIPNFFRYEGQRIQSNFKVKKGGQHPSNKSSSISPEDELNSLLEKVQKIGFHNLSAKEKDRLEELSRKLGD